MRMMMWIKRMVMGRINEKRMSRISLNTTHTIKIKWNKILRK